MKRFAINLGVLLLLAVLLWACGAVSKLQRKEKTELHSTSLVDRKELHTLSSQQSILFTDSSRQYSLVEIYPLGEFTYSAATGFVGNAAKVELKTVEQKAVVLEVNTLLEGKSVIDEVASEEVEILEVRKEREKEKKVPLGGVWWWVVGIVGIGLVLLIIKLKSFRKN